MKLKTEKNIPTLKKQGQSQNFADLWEKSSGEEPNKITPLQYYYVHVEKLGIGQEMREIQRDLQQKIKFSRKFSGRINSFKSALI